MNERLSFSPSDKLIALLVICILLLFCYYNRLSDDDFVSLKDVHARGIIGSMQHFYASWNTRWTAYLIENTWYASATCFTHPFFFNLLTLFLLVLANMCLIGSINRKWGSKLNTLLYGLILSGGLLSATYHIGDTWFWVNTAVMYGWPMICALLSLALLLRTAHLLHYPLLFLCGVLIGGGTEPFAFMLLLLLPLVGVNSGLTKQLPRLGIFFLWLGIILAFGIAVEGTGSHARAQLLPAPSIGRAFLRACYFTAKIIFFHSPLRLLATILILSPFYAVGNNLKKRLPVIPFKNAALLIGFLWALWIFSNTLIVTRIMGDYGPMRAWCSISFISTLSILTLWMLAGRDQLLHEKTVRFMGIAAIVLLAVTAVEQTVILDKYTKAFDQFITNGGEDPKNLPDAGMMHRQVMDCEL